MKRITASILIVAILLPARAFALFGVGDIVFDPTSFAQLAKAYAQGQSQLSSLGNIVGLNTQQLQTLKTIDTAIGVAKGAINPKELTTGQIAALSQGLGLDAKGTISKIYKASGPFAGSLDIFMGASVESFRQEQGGPWQNLESWAVNQTMQSIGAATGMESNEIEFTKTVARMDPATRQQSQGNILKGLAVLATDRYAKAAEQRRVALQAESNLSAQAAQRASESKNIADTMAAQSEQAASNARLQAMAAQQQNQANETLIIKQNEAQATADNMANRRAREDAERRLAQSLKGND